MLYINGTDFTGRRPDALAVIQLTVSDPLKNTDPQQGIIAHWPRRFFIECRTPRGNARLSLYAAPQTPIPDRHT